MKIFVIAPHLDNEILGCGGTILKHKDLRDQIYWLIITNIDEKDGWKREIVEMEKEEIKIIAEKYDFEKLLS